MNKRTIIEWVEGSLKDSVSFQELPADVKTHLNELIISEIEELFVSKDIEFNCIFMVKCSKKLRKANWGWLQTREWPFQNWYGIKKEALEKTNKDLNIQNNQSEMGFVDEEA